MSGPGRAAQGRAEPFSSLHFTPERAIKKKHHRPIKHLATYVLLHRALTFRLTSALLSLFGKMMRGHLLSRRLFVLLFFEGLLFLRL